MNHDLAGLYPRCLRAGFTIHQDPDYGNIRYIPWEQLRAHPDAKNLLRGLAYQTCLPVGAYPWDVERLLRPRGE